MRMKFYIRYILHFTSIVIHEPLFHFVLNHLFFCGTPGKLRPGWPHSWRC